MIYFDKMINHEKVLHAEQFKISNEIKTKSKFSHQLMNVILLEFKKIQDEENTAREIEWIRKNVGGIKSKKGYFIYLALCPNE